MRMRSKNMNRNDLASWSDEQVKELADSGDYNAMYEYGARLYVRDENREAFKYLYPLVKFNNSIIWGYVIDIVYGYEHDLMSDKELFELLLRKHNYSSSYHSYILAEFYRLGRGTRRNYKKYIELLGICSRDGSAYATYELAKCYERGYAVKKSLKKAYQTYNSFVDDHCRPDYWCSYKTAIYRLHQWGGAKKDMAMIKYELAFAAKVYDEARDLHIELFGEDPVPDKPRRPKQ